MGLVASGEGLCGANAPGVGVTRHLWAGWHPTRREQPSAELPVERESLFFIELFPALPPVDPGRLAGNGQASSADLRFKVRGF